MEEDHKRNNVLLSICLLIFMVFPLLAVCHTKTRVTSLPGFPAPLPFHLETGYVGVGESEDVQLFYYFVKSEENPKNDPLMLWITGGPGCSALSGLVYEIGPLHFNVVEYNGSLPNLVLNPYSWTKVASIIFLDSPVGTGFSYSRTAEESLTGDIKSCDQAYEFLRKWLLDHPEFLSSPVYIGGDSYSGKTVPLVVQDISDGNQAGNEPFINLKGYVLGNAATDPNRDKNMQVPYAHGMGLISDEIYESTKRSCEGEYINVNPSNAQCLESLQVYSQCVSKINYAHILEPLCNFATPRPKAMAKHRRSLGQNFKVSTGLMPPLPLMPQGPHRPSPALGCRTYGYLLSYYWINDNRVRKALNIAKGTVPDWQRCNFGLPYKYDIQSSYEYHVNLSRRGYHSLIYSGDHDMTIPFSATQAWIRSLDYPIVDDWRSWFVDGQVGGYTRTYSNKMTFATIKGGGHTAPEYNPKECYAMFERWISNEPL